LSVSFGSSRAMAREGPPHPPAFKKIRIGVAFLPFKYSAIFSVADFVISSIIFSFYKNHLYDRTILKPMER
jgi:hypothetical protein